MTASGADRVEHLLLDHILATRRNARSIFILMAGCGGLVLLMSVTPWRRALAWLRKHCAEQFSCRAGGELLEPCAAHGVRERHPVRIPQAPAW